MWHKHLFPGRLIKYESPGHVHTQDRGFKTTVKMVWN